MIVPEYIRQRRTVGRVQKRVRTILNVRCRPDRLARPDHTGTTAREGRLDKCRDLDRVRIRDPCSGELVRRCAVDRCRGHDVRADVACGVGLQDEKVDVAVERVRRDGLELGDVRVVVYGLGSELATGVVRHERRTRLSAALSAITF